MTNNRSPAEVESGLLAVLKDFQETTELAETWAKKWKVKAQLVEGSTWAFYTDDGKIKVVGVLVASKDNGPSVKATKLYHAAEWALRCGTNLVIIIGNRKATVDRNDLVEAMSTWMPYVGPAGVYVPLGPLFTNESLK